MKQFFIVLIIASLIFIIGCSKNNPLTPLVYNGEVPFPISPEDGAVISNFQINLEVKNAKEYNDDQSIYIFQIATDKLFRNIEIQESVKAGYGTTSLKLYKNLAENVPYYWRVKATKGDRETPFSVSFSFIISSTSKAPEPLYPLENEVELNQKVILKVRASKNFTQPSDIYHFEIYRGDNLSAPIWSKDVAAQPEIIQVIITSNFEEGLYRWRANAYRRIFGDLESTLYTDFITFYIAEDCSKFQQGSKWAVEVIESNITCNGYNTYRNVNEALGPPDAMPTGPDSYTGFVSLGIDGWITVRMGRCMKQGAGSEIKVYQTVSYEAVGVSVAETPEGPWHFLGIRACNIPTPYFSASCEFEFSGNGVQWARYARIYDMERVNMPQWAVCELDPPHPGADIDAVEVLNPY